MNFAKKPSEAVCCIQRTQANPLPSKETAEGILFYSIPNKQLEKVISSQVTSMGAYATQC